MHDPSVIRRISVRLHRFVVLSVCLLGLCCGTAWGQAEQQKLEPTEIADGFGEAVAVDSEVAIVGAVTDSPTSDRTGSAFVFRYDEATEMWSEETTLTPTDLQVGDLLGSSVAIDGGVAVVGSPGVPPENSIYPKHRRLRRQCTPVDFGYHRRGGTPHVVSELALVRAPLVSHAVDGFAVGEPRSARATCCPESAEQTSEASES